LKELRIQSRGVFAFDPNRTAIVLCAGNQVGHEKRFYQERLSVTDWECTHWLNSFKDEE